MYNAGSTLPIQTYLIPKCLALAEPVSLTTFRINIKAKHQHRDTSRFESMVSKTLIFLMYTYYEKYTYIQIVKHTRHQIIHVILKFSEMQDPTELSFNPYRYTHGVRNRRWKFLLHRKLTTQCIMSRLPSKCQVLYVQHQLVTKSYCYSYYK